MLHTLFLELCNSYVIHLILNTTYKILLLLLLLLLLLGSPYYCPFYG